MQPTMKSALVNGAVLIATITLCLAAGEPILHWRYPERPRKISDEVRHVQAYLKLDPKIGFTWKDNIPFKDHIVLKISDTHQEPLSTDRHGFINPPAAIKTEQSGAPIQVIGLGDSFMEHGSFLFHTLFKDAGLTYYSMAIHRQCPPQYNLILREYALQKKPRWILYGLYENDFDETKDFENWTHSGMDWFTYHSGTWCGRPQTGGLFKRMAYRWLPGYCVAYQRALEKFKLTSLIPTHVTAVSAAKVCGYVRRANALAKAHGIRFLLLLIPSKETTLHHPTRESALYDQLVGMLAADPIEALDLRRLFRESADPASLFYRIDGHWNRNGIRLAASAILNYIKRHEAT